MSTGSVVDMKPDQVKAIASGLETIAGVLKVVSGVLEAQMYILRATAFIGLVGGLAVERYIASIKPPIDQLAKRLSELSTDVNKSVAKWEAASSR